MKSNLSVVRRKAILLTQEPIKSQKATKISRFSPRPKTRAILNLKGENTMQIRFKRLTVAATAAVFLTSCSVIETLDKRFVYWWNNGSATRPYDKEEKVYYAQETEAQQENREINAVYCNELGFLPENRIYNEYHKNGMSNKYFFHQCMKDRGSPQYEPPDLEWRNDRYCSYLALLPENRIFDGEYKYGRFNSALYDTCMQERGTPVEQQQ